jgi:hypothetical protein
MVVQANNLSYLGGRDWEDFGSRPAPAKKIRPPFQPMAGSGDMYLSFPQTDGSGSKPAQA